METKPYNLQSPEQIAKDYGGNKQKIAEAMQMGIVDPTAGTLAGMFIDRMRSAQMQEQAPQQTVAEQVFAPPQPAPAAAPPQGGAPAGLGVTPEAAQMPQQMPPMPPQGAPMGMAAGGLTTLPLPDTMFDEPDDGGYAGGGLVAFAPGGPVGSLIEQQALGFVPGVTVTSRQRSAAKNAQVGGVANSYHLTDNARDFVPPKGMTMGQLHAQLKSKFGGKYDVINEGDHVHIEPGPGMGAGSKQVAQPTAAPAGGPAAPWGGTLSSQIPNAFQAGEDYYAKNMPVMKNEGINALAEEARKVLTPEEQKKRRDADKWATLAEIGFGIAGSSSPYLLQAVGAAASAALPGARAAKKEREAEKRQAYRDLAEAEGITYKQAMDKANYVRDVAKDRLDISDKDITRGFQQQQTVYQQGEETKRAQLSAQTSKDVATINADSYRDYSAQQNEQLKKQAALKAPEEARARATEDPAYRTARDAGDTKEMQRLMRKYANDYYFEVTGENLPSATPPKDGNANKPAPPKGGPKEGQKGKAANGRDMVFQSGQWVYVK